MTQKVKAKRNGFSQLEDYSMSLIYREVLADTNSWKKVGSSPLKMFKDICKQIAKLTLQRHYSGKAFLGVPQFEPRKYDSIYGHVKDIIIPHEKKIDPGYRDELLEMREGCINKSQKYDYDALAVAFYMKHHLFYTAISIRNFLELKSISKTRESSPVLIQSEMSPPTLLIENFQNESDWVFGTFIDTSN